MALPVPGILVLCNYLQNVVAITYIFVLQLSTFLFYNKQSAILLNDDCYRVLLNGKVIRNSLSVLRPEYIILFKAKAYLDLKMRKDLGEKVDSSDIKKHKKDVLRIAAELILEKVEDLPITVNGDIHSFIESLEQEPFDQNSLKRYGLKNEDVVDLLHLILHLLQYNICHNTPIYARKQFFTRAHKARNTKKNKEMRGYATMIKILFICHGNV